ncbi:MAG: hypothetical protein IAC58_01200 [Firmicutes bacterium]|uniref:Uncharacterized protein n=1 Tax=Candidatus Onthovivens merdipullorum TaxID=2840889 RepID=A0A9D9GTY8_9BACL|nr:hypothetical protein [Candidatus Onthovivens merdipullorum]
MILPRYDLKILTKSLCYNATRLMCTLFIKSLNSNSNLMVKRIYETSEVIDILTSSKVLNTQFFIIRLRGMGKTTFFKEILTDINNESNYLVISLNCNKDIISNLVKEL